MKLTKRKNDNSTIRKVWNDEKTYVYGIIGTVEDLLEAKILEFCSYNPETWCWISLKTEKAYFARERQDLFIYMTQFE